MEASGANRIVVDLDDTLVENQWPDLGDWLPGAQEALRAFLDAGYEVFVFSTRLAEREPDERTPRSNAEEIWKVRRLLRQADLDDVGIWTYSWKPGAEAYIDDKALRFEGNWPEIVNRIVKPPDQVAQGLTRLFDTGATRDVDEHKLNYRRFFSSLVLRRRAEYMQEHRKQNDGSLRDPDNWKKGIPLESYADSAWRHHWDFWALLERGETSGKAVEDALCALMFNAEGYLYELLKDKADAE